MLKRVAIAVGLWAVASVASADVLFTKWGMTPEQVLAAGKGQATPATKYKTIPVEINAAFDVSGVTINHVEFVFRDGGLVEVQMIAADGQYAKLAEVIAGSAGRPTFVDESRALRRRVYRDPGRGNIVEVLGIGDGVTMTYKMLDAGGL